MQAVLALFSSWHCYNNLQDTISPEEGDHSYTLVLSGLSGLSVQSRHLSKTVGMLAINNSFVFCVTIYLSHFNLFLTSLNPVTYSVHLRSLWNHTPQFFVLECVFIILLHCTVQLRSTRRGVVTVTRGYAVTPVGACGGRWCDA